MSPPRSRERTALTPERTRLKPAGGDAARHHWTVCDRVAHVAVPGISNATVWADRRVCLLGCRHDRSLHDHQSSPRSFRRQEKSPAAAASSWGAIPLRTCQPATPHGRDRARCAAVKVSGIGRYSGHLTTPDALARARQRDSSCARNDSRGDWEAENVSLAGPGEHASPPLPATPCSASKRLRTLSP